MGFILLLLDASLFLNEFLFKLTTGLKTNLNWIKFSVRPRWSFFGHSCSRHLNNRLRSIERFHAQFDSHNFDCSLTSDCERATYRCSSEGILHERRKLFYLLNFATILFVFSEKIYVWNRMRRINLLLLISFEYRIKKMLVPFSNHFYTV